MRRLTLVKEMLWAVAVFGAVAIVARLFGGLGVSTDLSDAMPWGLWKILNMVAGVALATGGFALAFLVIVLGVEKYRPLLKPAILLAFLGYGSSCFALFLDIGLPHAIWKPIVFWNHHSFLFEVAWCVMLYFSVTALEMAPPALMRLGMARLAHGIHRAIVPIAIIGITLSTLHHTSLGSLFLTMPARMHPLWFTSALPVLFILSAVGAGLQALILLSLIHSRLYLHAPDYAMLKGLARISAAILGVWLTARLIDLARRGGLALLASGQWETGFFYAELTLSAIVPIAFIVLPRLGPLPRRLAAASVCAVIGLMLNRLNVGVISLIRTSDTPYFPSLMEIAVSAGVFAMAGLAFFYCVEWLPIFADAPSVDPARKGLAARGLDSLGRAWAFGVMTARMRVSLIMAVAASLALALFLPDAAGGVAMVRAPVRPPLAADAMRASLRLDGDRNRDVVIFDHDAHKQRGGEEKSCEGCHHLNLPGDSASPCWRCHSDMKQPASIFGHSQHIALLGDRWSCEECHGSGQDRSAASAQDCAACHEQYTPELMTHLIKQSGAAKAFMARSYEDAMHGSCLACHKKMEAQAGKPMSQCAFCHKAPSPDRDGNPPKEMKP